MARRIFENTNVLLNSQYQCTIASMINVASIRWLAVKCQEPILNNILCRVEKVKMLNFTRQPISHSCNEGHILNKNTCFSFIACQRNSSTQPRYPCTNFNSSTKSLQFIFDCLSIKFPAVFSGNMYSIFTYTKHFYVYEYHIHDIKRNETVRALYPCTYHTKHTQPSSQLFSCKHNIYISQILVCDDNNNCLEEQPLDETGCKCFDTNSNSTKCKFVADNQNLTKCSDFYYTDVDGSCHLYYFEETSAVVFKEKSTILNDVEMMLLCEDSSEIYYNISDICIYRLNSNSQLIPCAHGEHLQNCSSFECNAMFHCPGYFCIPWGYLCNGKWDCPAGYDESDLDCGYNRKCIDRFRCANTGLCIHLIEICNGVVDCPFSDDEYACSLTRVICPEKCACLTFVLKCNSVTVGGALVSEQQPFQVVYIQNSNVLTVSAPIFHHLTRIVSLSNVSMTHTDLCRSVKNLNLLLYFSASKNNLSMIDQGCFSNKNNCVCINLTTNMIYKVSQNSFSNLPSLSYLDLSHNSLCEFPDHFISNISHLALLAVSNNTIATFHSGLFKQITIKILKVDQFELCCALNNGGECTAQTPWTFSCTSLLKNNGIKITFYSISIPILLLNIISLGIHRGLHEQAAFEIKVFFINIADFLCGLYLCILWSADLAYSDSFVMKAKQWQGSALCFISCCLNILFNFMLPYLLSLLALARLEVVDKPLETNFKNRNYVLKWILSGSFGSIFMSCGLTCLVILTNSYALPTSLCSAYIDPSDSVIAVRVSIFLNATFQLVAIVLIIVLHIKLVISLKASQIIVKKSSSKSVSNLPLYVQLIFVSGTNILCWLPNNILFLLSSFMSVYPVKMLVWTTITVVPINSLVNPILFLILALRKTQNPKKCHPKCS